MEDKIVKELLAVAGYEANMDVEVDQEKYPRPDWAVDQIVRSSGLVENVCCHGVGHPHPVSVQEFEDRGIHSAGVHGCDMCCCDEETKKRMRAEIKEKIDKESDL